MVLCQCVDLVMVVSDMVWGVRLVEMREIWNCERIHYISSDGCVSFKNKTNVYMRVCNKVVWG